MPLPYYGIHWSGVSNDTNLVPQQQTHPRDIPEDSERNFGFRLKMPQENLRESPEIFKTLWEIEMIKPGATHPVH